VQSHYINEINSYSDSGLLEYDVLLLFEMFQITLLLVAGTM